MPRRFHALGLALLLGPVTLARASHSPDLSPAEVRCQLILGPATDRLGARQARCLARCDRKARAGRVPVADCTPPYAGTTRTCVAAADAAELAVMRRACASDCPECYDGADCTAFTAGAVTATSAVVSGLAGSIFCEAGTPVDAATGRCRQAAASVLARVAVATGRCIVACQQRAHRGLVSSAACTATPITDPALERCVDAVVTRGDRQLTKACAAATGCLADTVPTLVERVRAQIEFDYRSIILCGSPSAAFTTPAP